jgi:hypothetical protein
VSIVDTYPDALLYIVAKVCGDPLAQMAENAECAAARDAIMAAVVCRDTGVYRTHAFAVDYLVSYVNDRTNPRPVRLAAIRAHAAMVRAIAYRLDKMPEVS